eukprot:s5694_g1.t1
MTTYKVKLKEGLQALHDSVATKRDGLVTMLLCHCPRHTLTVSKKLPTWVVLGKSVDEIGQGEQSSGPEIKIGFVKQAAIRALLSALSTDAYKAMEIHCSLMPHDT